MKNLSSLFKSAMAFSMVLAFSLASVNESYAQLCNSEGRYCIDNGCEAEGGRCVGNYSTTDSGVEVLDGCTCVSDQPSGWEALWNTYFWWIYDAGSTAPAGSAPALPLWALLIFGSALAGSGLFFIRKKKLQS